MNRLLLVVGGQFGSEAKGKAVQYLSSLYPTSLAVRSGGINAGHTVEWQPSPDSPTRSKFVSRTLPSAFLSRAGLCLSAGSYISPSLLKSEIERLSEFVPDLINRLFIDQNAFVISPDDAATESGWAASFGSTQTGTGAAAIRRIQRSGHVLTEKCLAKDDPYLCRFVVPSVADLVSRKLADLDFPSTVILEGTQGYGLSLYHGPWPFTTSRDTTAAALLSECGIAGWDTGPFPSRIPRFQTEVCLVVRTYPIRVGGPSGPLHNEISWTDVAENAGRSDPLTEITSVTKRVRRVAAFDWDLFRRAVQANRPSYIALHGLDYLDATDLGKTNWSGLSRTSHDFVDQMEKLGGVPVRLLFTGPQSGHLIDREIKK